MNNTLILSFKTRRSYVYKKNSIKYFQTYIATASDKCRKVAQVE